MQKKLSIIIPTKDRYDTLFQVVTSIVEFVPTEFLEIVISDNTVNNAKAEEFITSNKYKGIINYSHCTSALSMVENTERALSLATGKYLLFIGDDDFVSPYIMKVVEMMENKGVDSLVYPIANYFYDNVEFFKQYAFNKPATLQIVKNPDLSFLKRNTAEEKDRICASGAIFIGRLPRLYHGIINRYLLERVIEKYHKSVPGPCPDMTLSMALAEIMDDYYFIEYPVSVSGASSASEGGKGPTKKHVVRLEEKKWLNQKDIKDWDCNLPRIFSRETIWAQCVYHVMRISGDSRIINYQKLYSSMLIDCPKGAIPEVTPLYHSFIKKNNLSQNMIFKDYFTRFVKGIIFRLPSFVLEALVYLRGDYKSMNCVSGLRTVKECMQYIKNNYPIL
jgi:glycosyltransferase involved in cell wall biosynthesis